MFKRTLQPFTAVENQVIDDDRLHGDDVLVYLVLARHADNETRTCFPSTKRICARSGLSLTRARVALRRLSRFGYLHIKKRPGFASHYTLGPSPVPLDENYKAVRSRVQKRKVSGKPFSSGVDPRRGNVGGGMCEPALGGMCHPALGTRPSRTSAVMKGRGVSSEVFGAGPEYPRGQRSRFESREGRSPLFRTPARVPGISTAAATREAGEVRDET